MNGTALRHVVANGITLRVAVEGVGPLVVLVHGFPESWYSWRHQLGPLAAAGFTACAIDVRGYGGSDKPHAVEAYDMEAITGDVAGVIAALSPDAAAVVVGHDWGAPVAWYTALLHAERVRAVAGLSVPFTGPPPEPLIDIFHRVYTDRGKFFYMVYFQDEGVAETEFSADVRVTLRKLYYTASGEGPGSWSDGKVPGQPLLANLVDPAEFPSWMTPADLDHYVGEFERSGFRGGLNRYRNFRRDFDYLRKLGQPIITQPALFIGGEHDGVLQFLNPAWPDLMAAAVPNLRGLHTLPGIGHWTQQEAPDAVNALLLDWLRAL